MEAITNTQVQQTNINLAKNLKAPEEKSNSSEKKQISEKTLKIASAAIGAVVIGGLGYLAHKKISAKNANKITETINGMVKSGSLVKKANGKLTVPSKAQNIAKEAKEIAKRSADAAEQIASGKSANSIRKNATKNLTHNGKKWLKETSKKQ